MHSRRNPARRPRKNYGLWLAAACAALPSAAWATNWTDGSGNWNTPGNWSAGVPTGGSTVNIAESDGVNRVINYDFPGSVTIGALTVNLYNGGTTATTVISMTANNLTTNVGEIVGGTAGGSGGGTGAFIQSGGVNTNSNALDLGLNAHDSGYYQLSGGMLVDTDYELVGVSGTGTFLQSGNVNSMTSGSLVLGDNAGSEGTYTLSAGRLVDNGFEAVGYSGSGTFVQTDGQNIASGGLYVAENATSVGSTYTLSGGTLAVSDGENIGYLGTGSFIQTGGIHAFNDAGILDIGESAGSDGNYNLSGTGTLTTVNSEMIGDKAGATGAFTQLGGTNTIGSLGSLNLGYQFGATGSYTLGGNGSLSITNGELIGNTGAGVFTQTGGTNTVGTLGYFYLGTNTGSTGSYTLSGGTLTASNEIIGFNGNATFVQTGGINNDVAGGPAGVFTVGFQFGTASYTLSAGTLTTSGENIGYFGSATFIQTGGLHYVSGANGEPYVTIGSQPGSCGTYSLSGGLYITAPGVDITAGFTGNGTLNVSGGELVCGKDILINSYASYSGTNNGTMNFSGGTVVANSILIANTQATFNWTGGTLQLNDSQTYDPLAYSYTFGVFGSSFLLGSGQTLIVNADETLGGTGSFTMELGPGSAHSVVGTLTVTPSGTLMQDAGSTLYAANIIQDGTINGYLQNQGNFDYISGPFNGELINQGTVNLGPDFTAGNGIENDATMNLTAGELITVNGLGLDNFGSFTLGGATLLGNGPVVNDFGGTMQAHGTIDNSFTNEGILTLDGVLHLNGGGVNSGIMTGSGTIQGSFSNNGGDIELASGNVLSISNSWTNGGLVTLTGGVLGGGTILNTSTMRGAGTVSSPINNNAGVIRATGGELDLLANGNANGAGGQIQIPTGGTVLFSKGLAGNGGSIALTGGTFDNNNYPINNTGYISGYGTFRSGGLTNNGNFNLSGTSGVFGTVVNNAGLHISGASQVSFFGAVSGGSTVQVDSGAETTFYNTFTGTSQVTNNGAVSLLALSSSGNIIGSGGLTIGSSTSPASLQLSAGSGISSQSSLIINPGSTLDLTNNAIAINFGAPANDPITTIVSELTNGHSGATVWTGTSVTAGVITSSTAAGSHTVTLGYLDGNIDTGLPAVAANQIVVKYVLVGDSDLSGEVDFTDLASVLKHFNQAGTDWAQGNFEYAANSPSIASTNFNDLADVLKNFLQTTPGGASETVGGTVQPLATTVQIMPATPVPEPTGLSLLAAGAAALLRRRRRSRMPSQG